jgi:hypothetical protein
VADVTLSVEECAAWMVHTRGASWASEVASIKSRDVGALNEHAREHLAAIRWRREHSPFNQGVRDRLDRMNLAAWALCRAAIRAIEAERPQRRGEG